MTLPSTSSSLLRRTAIGVSALAGLAALGFATAAAVMFFWVLPNIGEHRQTVADLMSRALDQRVTIDGVSGAWQQARPEFRMQGVRLYDRDGRLALHLPDLTASFAWRSLLILEPRFNHIELTRLELDVRRARDGHLYVGGVPVNPADPDSGFSSWLLRQGRVHIDAATVTWNDELRAAPPLTLTAVDFTLSNVLQRHRIVLRATPPAELARPLVVDARLHARDVDDPKTWRGSIEAQVAGVSFPHLAPWLAIPYQPRKGWGALSARFDVTQGRVTAARAAMDLRAIETVVGEGLPALRMDQVQGRAVWTREGTAHRVAFEALQLALPGARLGAPFDMGLAWDGAAHEVTARGFSLGGWQALLPSLPMDAALRERLRLLQPQGRLERLRFGWRGAEPGLDNFSVSAQVRGVGVTAAEGLPGLENLSGQIEGDARGGSFDIDSKSLALSLPKVFREPRLAFDAMRVKGGWKRTTAGRVLRIDESEFANADTAGSARGSYEFVRGGAGKIDLNVRLTRAEGRAVYRYLPRVIGEQTVEWVRDGIVAGHSDDVRLELRGDLDAFPFEAGNGVFRLEAQVKDATIDYVEGWPRIEGVQANLLFSGKTMEVTSREARIYGVALAPVRAFIPDLIHHEEILEVEGTANGPIQDFIRFANFSPVGETLRGFTDTLQGSGPMRLALKLTVPLRHTRDTTVSGRLSFLDDTLFPSGLPRIDRVRGDIAFTQDGLSAKQITARFLDGALRVDAATHGDRVRIVAQGRATAAGLAPWLGRTWGGRLSGQTVWRGQVDLLADGDRVHVESDLVGLESTLPAPLAKAAAQSLPLTIDSQPHAGGRQNEVRLGKTVGAVWRSTADSAFERGEIRFGGPAQIPAEPGLRVAGNGHALEFSGWLAMLPGGESGRALPLASVDLGFDALDLMGRRYEQIRLQGRVRNGLFRAQVSGRNLDGVVTYRPAGEQAARMSAQFKQFTIPAAAPATGTAGARNMRANGFPLVDVVVEDFRLESRPLGRLEAVARGTEQGLAIERLKLAHPDSVFEMSGLWRDTGLSETRADLSLKVVDVGRFLGRFGYPDTVRRGSAEMRGNATWEGSPADFGVESLAGQIDFKARDGQFLKVDPGAAKLLGVLSLQSLPRRLNFDFRDIFNEGYAFDEIGATLRIARGVVYSDDFRMRGPSAKVNMSGMADLNQESVQLRLKVIPKLSEGVAVAGALIGGPLAGVGALAAQKILRDPVEEAISQEYMVTGPWQALDVKRLPKAKAETQGSEP